MYGIAIFVLLVLLAWPAQSDDSEREAEPEHERTFFKMDENVWVSFYDVPSRRFRSIRDSFIRRDFEAASRALEPTIGFLLVEAERASLQLQPALLEVIDQLRGIRERIDEPSVTVSSLDAAFARAHWLLSQHYLVLAMKARDDLQHEMAGRYLWATAHHLERTVLWSDARIDDDVMDSLEGVRELSVRLQESPNPSRVYRDKPIVLTARTLVAIGEYLDRKVWIDAPTK